MGEETQETSGVGAETSAHSSQRGSWIDASKGLGILLVVFGHTLRGLFNAELLPEDGAWGALDRFIYAFHMPLFFFVSGLFLLPELARQPSFPRFVQKRLLRLGYPYLVWGSLQTAVQIAMSRQTNNPAELSSLWTIVFDPPMQFWFLYVLMLQTLLIGALGALGCGRKTVFAVACVVFASAPFVPLGGWGALHQVRNYLPFTALGVLVGAPQRLRALGSLGGGPGALAFAAACFALVGVLVAYEVEAQRVLAVLAGYLGTVGSVCVSLWLSMRHSVWFRHLGRWLVALGRASLAIFVSHTLASAAVRIGLQRILHVDDVALHLVLGTVAGFAFPLALLAIAKRYDLPYLFEWPYRVRKPEPAPEAPARDSRPSIA